MQPYSPLKMVKYRNLNLHFFTKPQLHIDLHKNSKKSHTKTYCNTSKIFWKTFQQFAFYKQFIFI